MLGVGAVAVVGAIAVIAFAALNQGGDSNGAAPAASDETFPAYAHILGDPDAPVTVVEYSDIK